MSRRAALAHRLGALKDIRDIMNAMKNLSLMETRKLTHVLSTQRVMLETLEEELSDFAEFFPEVVPDGPDRREIRVLLGSERGFCGDFNETVIAADESDADDRGAVRPAAIVVGSRLASKLPAGRAAGAVLSGPSTVEEIPSVLLRLMEAVDAASRDPRAGSLRLTVVAHDAERREARVFRLRPFPEMKKVRLRHPRPPLLNVAPKVLAADLADHYLFARLSGLFDSSLLAENQFRLQHMENAIRHLDQETAETLVRKNRLRQEEIVEEIEVLLLNDGGAGPGDPRRQARSYGFRASR